MNEDQLLSEKLFEKSICICLEQNSFYYLIHQFYTETFCYSIVFSTLTMKEFIEVSQVQKFEQILSKFLV